MARIIRQEWKPSSKNAGRAYGAILSGMAAAFNEKPRAMTCKIICEDVRRRIDIRNRTRCVYFGITRDGEILMGLYSNHALVPVTEYNLMSNPCILNARGGWMKGVARLVRELIKQASKEDDSFETTIALFLEFNDVIDFLTPISLDAMDDDDDLVSDDDDIPFDWDQCHSMLGV